MAVSILWWAFGLGVPILCLIHNNWEYFKLLKQNETLERLDKEKEALGK